MDAYDKLLNGLRRIPAIDNGWDRQIAPFSGSLEYDQKRFSGIPTSEKIVYIRIIEADKTVPWSLAITDKGIYMRSINKFFWATVSDKTWSVQFSNINDVKYSERDDSFVFSDGSSIGRHALVKSMNNSDRFEFAKILTDVARSIIGVEDCLNEGIDLLEKERYNEALSKFNKAIDLISEDKEFAKSDERAYVYFWTGRCLMLLDRDSESKTNLILARDIAKRSTNNDMKDLLPAIYANLAYVVESRIESHKLLVEAFDKVSDTDAKKELLNDLNSLHASDNFKACFNSHNKLSERKVILILRDNTTPIHANSMLCFERKVIKSLGITFPLGHPIDGAVYVAHPTRSSYYVPASAYEESIFLEKVNEYCYLLRCLGAREIKIHKISGKSIEEMNRTHVDTEISGGYKSFEAGAGTKFSRQENSSSSNNYEFSSHMSFKPTGKPYVPNDLNWLAVEPRWQRLIDNRLAGILTNYKEEISTSEDKLLSQEEEFAVNLEIKTLLVKFKSEIRTRDVFSSSSRQATTWSIEVSF